MTPGAFLSQAHAALAEAAEVGLAADVAALYLDDPPEAEAAVRDMVFGLARTVLRDVSGTSGGHGPSLEADGRTCGRAQATPGRAMTVFGPVGFPPSWYRPAGTGASLVPSEAVPGLTACVMTPAAASLVRLSGGAGNRMRNAPASF